MNEPIVKSKVKSSEKSNIPINVANMTLKKSKGITTVDLPNFNPLIVKNCANKPKNVAPNIINVDFRFGNKATFVYGKNKNIQLKKENQNCMVNVFWYNVNFFINIFTTAIKNAANIAYT